MVARPEYLKELARFKDKPLTSHNGINQINVLDWLLQ